MTQQFEKLAHQNPAQEDGEAQHSCIMIPSDRAFVIEIQKKAIPNKGPLQQCRLIDGVRTPWLLSAIDISFR